jgi:hypothetical protein
LPLHGSRVIPTTEGQTMNGFTKLVGVAVIAVAAATASFQDDVALALGVTALVAAAFMAVAVLVGAAVATRHARPSTETRRAPALDATPVISPLQEQ